MLLGANLDAVVQAWALYSNQCHMEHYAAELSRLLFPDGVTTCTDISGGTMLVYCLL